jgi:hypothetical protein
LSTDPELSKPIIDEKVRGTAYNLNWGLSYRTAYFWQVTPLEPVPGDPSPAFSFTTADGPALPSRFIPLDDNSTNALLITLILVILFGLFIQVTIYQRRLH